MLVATPINGVLTDNTDNPIDDTANVLAITVGSQIYTNLVAPVEAVLENVPPEAFDPFWGSSATAVEPTNALDALGGFDLSNGVLNPNTEGPASGLRNRVCICKPPSDKAAPAIMAVNALGIRIFSRILTQAS